MTMPLTADTASTAQTQAPGSSQLATTALAAAKKAPTKTSTKARPTAPRKAAVKATSPVKGQAPIDHLKPAAAPKKSSTSAPVKAATPKAPAKSKATLPKVATAQTTTAKTASKKKSAAPGKPAKDKKVKVVRDSFTLPKSELVQIDTMKKRAMTLGVEVKKSELIRAGLQALSGMADTAFKKAMASVPTIKTGRPAKV